MKVLSIKYPWSYLIAVDIKNVENRGWATNFRGRVLIHTSNRPDATVSKNDLIKKYHVNPFIAKYIFENQDKCLGKIIGEVNVIDVVDNSPSKWAMDGQKHWYLNYPELYDEFIPTPGKLNLWDFPTEKDGTVRGCYNCGFIQPEISWRATCPACEFYDLPF